MVGVANVGSMNIKGSLDTSLIERGFNRVKGGFDKVKGQAKGFTSDLTRMSTITAGLAKKMGLLALAGGTAMVTLAKSAPAVAPALAKMKVSMMRLSFALGEALAPAFERVSVWLEKFATWVGNNKEKIGEIANKFLDFGQTIAESVYPILKKVGNWALDHPNLFAGIVAGLVLGPKAIAGITAISGLVTTLSSSVVAGSLLTALGYIAVIGGLSFAGYKGAEALVNKLNTKIGLDVSPVPTQMTAGGYVSRFQQSRKYEKEGILAPWETDIHGMREWEYDKTTVTTERTLNGAMHAGNVNAEQDRRFFLLSWWDALWS